MENKNIINEIDKINEEIYNRISQLSNSGIKTEKATPAEIINGFIDENFLSALPKPKPNEEIIGYLKM